MTKHYTFRFPEVLENIEDYCHDNAMGYPVRMLLHEKTFSKHSEPMAVYRCPVSGRKSGYVIHRTTGQPFRLWTAKPKS